MTRAIPAPTFLLMALVVAASGCASGGELARRAGPPIEAPWHAEISPQFRNIRVAVTPGCVLVFGRTAIDADEPQRLIRCLDPSAGTERWSRVLEVPAGLVRDTVHASQAVVIYQSGDRAIGLDPDTGATLWTFDPGGRDIRAAVLRGDRFYLSADRETLVTLDAHDGDWIAGHGCDGHTLVGVVRGPRGALAVVRIAEPEPALVALDLTSEGASAAAPPFPTAREAWRVPVGDARDFRVVADDIVLVTPERLWAVDGSTGTTVRDIARPPAPGPRRVSTGGLGMRSFPPSDPGLTKLDPGDFVQAAPTPPRKGLSFGARALVSHSFRTGVLLEMVEIEGWDHATFTRKWLHTRHADGRINTVQETPDLHAWMIASPSQVLLLDADSGDPLHAQRIDPLRSGWTGIATNGRGLYVLYGNDPAPRLEALPLAPPRK